jgi:hypothetical protein
MPVSCAREHAKVVGSERPKRTRQSVTPSHRIPPGTTGQPSLPLPEAAEKDEEGGERNFKQHSSQPTAVELLVANLCINTALTTYLYE